MTTNNNETNKLTRFLRNHAALLLLIFCVVAIASVVLIVTLADEQAPVIDDVPVGGTDITPSKPDDVEPQQPTCVKVYFAAPVAFKSVSMEYSDGAELMFVFNKTLGSWSTHKGVDLVADEGVAVNAMFDGTVVDVSESYGMGGVVKIDHGDNVVCTYASLSDIKVVKGQQVSKGEAIGAASTTASYEFSDGAHVHLEVAVDGKSVDPMPYIDGEIFREVRQD